MMDEYTCILIFTTSQSFTAITLLFKMMRVLMILFLLFLFCQPFFSMRLSYLTLNLLHPRKHNFLTKFLSIFN